MFVEHHKIPYLITLILLAIVLLCFAAPAFADIDEEEGNNTFETATTSTMDTVTRGVITDADSKYSTRGDHYDEDYFKIDVPQDGKYTFSFANDTRHDRALFGNEYNINLYNDDFSSVLKLDIQAYTTNANNVTATLPKGTCYVKI